MGNHLKESVLIKNSKGLLYNFYLNECNGINYNSFNRNCELINTNNLINKDVLDFSACIDSSDTIHLIALNRAGKLKYFTYIDEVWDDSTVNTLDVRSNNYKYLNLIAFDDNIGFIYSYSNLINSEVWNIEFVSIKPTFEKKNIISVLAGQNFSPYSFDIDKFNDIHLLYRARENKSNQIYYMSFSPFLNIYKKPPIKISYDMSNNFHPNIFINSKNQIYAVWKETTSSNSDLKCMVLKEGISKFKALNIPGLKDTLTRPIILEESDTLKIICFIDNSLNIILSEDFGSSWTQGNSISVDNDSLYHSRYLSNYPNDQAIYNINHCYTNIDVSISMAFSDIFYSDYNSLEENVHEEKKLVDFNSNLQVNSIDCYYINETITKVEAFLSKNLIKLDHQVNLDNNYSDAIKKVETNLTKYKNENNDLLKLLEAVKNCSKENSIIIGKLESDLNYLKEQLEVQSNTFFKSLLSKFK